MLDNGAYVNMRNASGWTPLMLAVNTGDPELVEMILRNGANPYTQNRQGITAFEYAKGRGRSDVVDILKHYEDCQQDELENGMMKV